MRKVIFCLYILLVSFAVQKLSAQNVSKIYSSDSMTINKFFKVKTPQTGYKNGYFQLYGYPNLPNVDFRNMNVYRIMKNFVADNMHNNAFKSYYNLCSPPFSGIAFGGVIDFTFSEQDSNLILSSGAAAECEPYEGIGYSVNNGLSRTQIFSQTFMSFALAIAINPLKDSVMYCVYKSGANTPFVYKTTNRGTNWFVTDTIANTVRGMMRVNPFNANIVFLNGSSGLMRSTGGGYDFTPVSIPSAACMEFNTNGNSIFIGAIGTNGGIYKSSQDGLVWTRVFDIGCNTIEIDPLNNNTLYAGTNNGIYRSINNGASWELFNDGFSGNKSIIGIIKNPDMGDTLFAVTPKAAYKVYGEFKSFTEHNYLPLQIGNSWTYKQTAIFPPDPAIVSYNKVTIIRDTLISGKKYFITSSLLPSFTSNIIYYDSLTGNIFCYKESSSCSYYPKNDLVDSIGANIGDTIHSCPVGINGRVQDTNNVNVFNQNFRSKFFISPYWTFNTVTRRYAKNIGITYSHSGESSSVDKELTGCVINGVLYGDTTTFSPYKDYLPLKVGNSWTYETSYELPPTRYKTKVTIVADTIIGGIKYSKTSDIIPGFTGNLIRMDTLTGNILCFSQTPSCARYSQQLLIDSVAGKLNDSFTRCHNPSLGIITDTSNYSLPWQTVKSKKIYYTSIVDESHTYGYNFGLIEKQTIEGAPITTRLTGCVINGTLYGDTTSVSQYKEYLPLQVGNSWTYREYNVWPPLDDTITTTITSDTIIGGIKYFKFSGGLPSIFGMNLFSLDTATGNLMGYQLNSGCTRYPNRVLVDSLAARKGDSIKSCPSVAFSGVCRDTQIVNKFGYNVKTKSFSNTYPMVVYPGRTYSEKFGIISAYTSEVDIITYTLIRCTINGITYSDSLHNVTGTVKFADNSQPANNGYVKAVKLNTLTGDIVTYDSVQIQSGGVYQLHNLPSDLYYIVAYPNSEKQADFVPTYYPSTISWQTSIKVNSASNPSNVNISVFRKNNNNGNYHVAGQVNAQTNSLAGIGKAIVYIKEGNSFRDYYITTDAGQYNLDNLSSGNYNVIADRLGFTGAQQNVVINGSNLDNINFILERVGISNITTVIPKEYSLYQNYPNPFNPVTNIKFDLPKSGFATLKIYDVLGKEAAVLLNEVKQAGSYKADFNASNLPSGVYFYRLTAGEFTETRRMMLIK